MAIDLKKATYPQSYVPLLEQMKYRLDVDANKARESMDLFAEDLRETLRRREEALLHFIEKEEWDLFIATIAETDRLHHFLWAASDNPAHPYYGFFIEIYRWIDRIIGKLYTKVGKETAVFMVSDHGFTHIRSEVYLNKWLEEEGYLSFIKTPPESYRGHRRGDKGIQSRSDQDLYQPQREISKGQCRAREGVSGAPRGDQGEARISSGGGSGGG
ncbi:MAG: alkaline phosphatase family protein [Nitrospirae bacterium]|nr:alkaline phosphatase family protein [Nitrospirota bacterium]